MSTTTHGKLVVFSTYAQPELRTADDYIVAVISKSYDTDTARRLAACWNACKDLPTEAIERMEFPTNDAYERMRQERDELRNKLTLAANAKTDPIGYTISLTDGRPMLNEVQPTMADLRKTWSREIDLDGAKVYELNAVEVQK